MRRISFTGMYDFVRQTGRLAAITRFGSCMDQIRMYQRTRWYNLDSMMPRHCHELKPLCTRYDDCQTCRKSLCDAANTNKRYKSRRGYGERRFSSNTTERDATARNPNPRSDGDWRTWKTQ